MYYLQFYISRFDIPQLLIEICIIICDNNGYNFKSWNHQITDIYRHKIVRTWIQFIFDILAHSVICMIARWILNNRYIKYVGNIKLNIQPKYYCLRFCNAGSPPWRRAHMPVYFDYFQDCIDIFHDMFSIAWFIFDIEITGTEIDETNIARYLLFEYRDHGHNSQFKAPDLRVHLYQSNI